MRYLITEKNKEPYITSYFDIETNFERSAKMVVYDLHECKYTTDGYNWHDIENDEY